jgi:hypothetical protein
MESSKFGDERRGAIMKNFAVIFFLIPQFLFAQQSHKLTSSRNGSISGRIFLVTVLGDLKPARLIRVYVLNEKGLEEYTFESMQESVKRRRALAQEDDEHIKADPNYVPLTDDQEALLFVRDSEEEILSLVEKATKAGKRVRTTLTDEEGRFNVTGLPAGGYWIAAFGRAGANEATWDTSAKVYAASDTVVKMGSPDTSCVDLRGSK